MNIVKLLAILLIIPVLAFGVSLYYENKIDTEIQGQIVQEYPEVTPEQAKVFTVEALVFHPEKYGTFTFEPEVYLFLIMKYSSAVVAGLSLLLVLAVIGLSRLGSVSRDWLVKLFPPTVAVSSSLIAVLTVISGLLLVCALYYGEAALVGRVHFVVIGLAGFGALVGAIGIIAALRSAFRAEPLRVPEAELEEGHPMWTLVREAAAATGAQVPDVVVLGRLPTFFVYEGNFITEEFDRTGRLMYLSQDLSARLRDDEVRAILAHEFGHFLGKDLDYTKRFHFGYRTLGQALSGLGQVTDWALLIGRIPAMFFFQFLLGRFGTVERRFSRERELAADRLAFETYGVKPFTEGLAKVVLLAPLLEKARERLGEGESGEAPQDQEGKLDQELRALLAEETREPAVEAVARTQAHPFDTHPTLAERLQNAGVDPEATVRDLELLAV